MTVITEDVKGGQHSIPTANPNRKVLESDGIVCCAGGGVKVNRLHQLSRQKSINPSVRLVGRIELKALELISRRFPW